jgi:hypothetical protein
MTRDAENQARQIALLELSRLFAQIDRAMAAGDYVSANDLLVTARAALDECRASAAEEVPPKISEVRDLLRGSLRRRSE